MPLTGHRVAKKQIITIFADIDAVKRKDNLLIDRREAGRRHNESF